MKTNELRIGNLVFSTDDNKNGEVLLIDSGGIIFVNENGNVACAIMKKKLLSYDVLRISGELSIRKDNENYLFSAYEDNGYEWIDWGLISESDIDKILVNGKEMNIIDNLQYSFRICWITGNGEENIPSNHEEIKKGAVR